VVLDNKTMNSTLYMLTLFMLLNQFFISAFQLPTGIIIIFELTVLLFLVYLLPNINNGIFVATLSLQMTIIALWLLSSLIGLSVSSEGVFQYVMGLRLYGKYFVVFLIGAFILDQKKILKLLELFRKMVLLNIVLCSFQYFFLGYHGDQCGGIFGTLNTNSWMNVLLCIVSVYVIALYVHSQIKLRSLILNFLACVYIAALAEIKFFYFELAIILLLVIMFTKPNRKTITAGIVGVILLLVLSQMVEILWSSSSSSIFTWEGIQYYFSDKAYGYSSIGDLGRIRGIAQLNKMFFPDSTNLFGMGIGNCTYGTLFYNNYSYLHYIWFGYLNIYLEMGWAGLLLYILFFGSIILSSMKTRREDDSDDAINTVIYTIGECMAVIGVILLWYNTTIINYPGYFLFLTLSFPFAIRNDLKTNRGYA
jgi:hypothetical protein